MEPVTQEDDVGCSIACVAFVNGNTYEHAKEHGWTPGRNR